MHRLKLTPPTSTISTSKVRAIVNAKLPPADFTIFKLALLAIARDVANASGGFFSQASKEEKAALAAIAVALGLPPSMAVS